MLIQNHLMNGDNDLGMFNTLEQTILPEDPSQQTCPKR